MYTHELYLKQKTNRNIQSKKYYEKNKEKILKAQRDKYHREGGYSDEAKKIRKQKDLQRRQMKYQILIDEGLLTDCIICGFSKEMVEVIEFHHVDPSQKKGTVSHFMDRRDRGLMIEEAKKCVCMCANCHRMYHAGRTEIVEKYNRNLEKKNEGI